MDSISRPAASITTKARLKPHLGGLRHIERFLGLRRDNFLPTDAILISIDLEVASDRKLLHLSNEKPLVTQIGFARLDTRDIRSMSNAADLRNMISVHFFLISDLLLSKTGEAKAKAKNQCVFAKSQKIDAAEVPPIIIKNLQLPDDNATDGSLRNIVLVGQSIKEDLKVLRYLGIEPFTIAPVLSVVDTYLMARYALPPFSPKIRLEPGQDFTLAGILSELGCQPNREEFHNAGNDAVYSVYAMLLIAIEYTASRSGELSLDENSSLETLRSVVFKTLQRGVSTCVFRTPNAG
jgi:hypothetical protein